MKRLPTLILVGLVTFTVSAVISPRRTVHHGLDELRRVSGPPCREWLVGVEPQPGVPIQITIVRAVCNGPDEVKAQFTAENIGTVAISKFEIGGIDYYDRPVSIRKGVGMVGSNLNPHRTVTGVVGGSASNGVTGIPVLTSYKLAVLSVTYADGTTWKRTPLKEMSR